MKKWFLLAVVVAVSTVLTVMSWSVRAYSSSGVRWEYQVISTYGTSNTNPPPNVQQLNDAGAAGWELVTIHSGEYPKPGSGQFKTDYFLKRAK